jgi:hypothetical protein
MGIENSSRKLMISNIFARQIFLALESFADGLLWERMTRSYSSTWRRVANGFICEITKGKTIIALREAAK